MAAAQWFSSASEARGVRRSASSPAVTGTAIPGPPMHTPTFSLPPFRISRPLSEQQHESRWCSAAPIEGGPGVRLSRFGSAAWNGAEQLTRFSTGHAFSRQFRHDHDVGVAPSPESAFLPVVNQRRSAQDLLKCESRRDSSGVRPRLSRIGHRSGPRGAAGSRRPARNTRYVAA
jgi:hypothetical protein